MSSSVIIHPDSGLPAVHAAGELRVCGLLPNPEPSKKPVLFGAEATMDLTKLPARNKSMAWAVGRIKDQKTTSGCAGWSAAGGLETKLRLQGYSVPALSGSYVYSWINNGRDQGANPEDAMNAMETHGVCSEADNDGSRIFLNQIDPQADADAQRWKLSTAHLIPVQEQIIAALAMGEIVGFGIDIGANFVPDPQTGILPEYVPDRQLNGHGLYAIGWDSPFQDFLKDPSKAWILFVNSWTARWGLNGMAYMPMSYFFGPMFIAYAMRGVHPDPQSPGLPPDPT